MRIMNKAPKQGVLEILSPRAQELERSQIHLDYVWGPVLNIV